MKFFVMDQTETYIAIMNMPVNEGDDLIDIMDLIKYSFSYQFGLTDVVDIKIFPLKENTELYFKLG